MIRVTHRISIGESELREEFMRAGGPGGQHQNKTSTAVQLRFDAAGSRSLPEDVRGRLLKLAHGRLTGEGEVVIQARRYRSQERNRQDARERLVALIRRAARAPRKRKPTKPTRASRERRLERKRRQSEKKRERRRVRRPPTE